MITKLENKGEAFFYSPPELLGTLMGMWYLSASLSGYVGSIMAKMSFNLSSISVGDAAYYQTFVIIAVIILVMGMFALSTTPIIKKLTQS